MNKSSFFINFFAILAFSQQLLPPPASGLVGSSNYFLWANGSTIDTLFVQVFVQEDIILGENGISFQLNCYVPQNGTSSVLAVQRFGLSFDPPNNLTTFYDSWAPGPRQVAQLNLVEDAVANATILAGSFIQILLQNTPVVANVPQNYITSVSITTGPFYDSLYGATIFLQTVPTVNGSSTANLTTELGPITAFTFSIGGFGNGTTGVFKGGNGTVTYNSTSVLTPVNSLPAGLAALITGENSTAQYSQMEDTSGMELEQTWQAV
jgi:hypothetical protein